MMVGISKDNFAPRGLAHEIGSRKILSRRICALERKSYISLRSSEQSFVGRHDACIWKCSQIRCGGESS